MIKYFGGQHSIYVSPKTLATYYSDAKPNCTPNPNPNPNPNPTAHPHCAPIPNPNPRHQLHRRQAELCAHWGKG